MAKVSIEKIKDLRQKTAAGISDCVEALQRAKGNIEDAVRYLEKKGIAKAAARAERVTGDGIVASYVHTNDKLAVIVEVKCETDFVARNKLFRDFVKNVLLQIAGMGPLYISKDDVPKEVVKSWKSEIKESANSKEIEGRIKAKYNEVCLLEQQFFKDEKKTIGDMLAQVIAKTGENCRITRFVRLVFGQKMVVAETKQNNLE